MRYKTNDFLELLNTFLTEYLPYSAGLSDNTVRSYKYAFRLLVEFLYSKRNIKVSEISFTLLDYGIIEGFLHWLEEERSCTVSTRNQRLSALSSFAAYAQNRNFEVATVFMNSIQKIPVKKQTERSCYYFSHKSNTPLQATGHLILAAFAKCSCEHVHLAHCSRK